MIDLIWIKRISKQEDQWLEEYLSSIDQRYNIIIVGHTNISHKNYNFTYIPFYENGVDELGLICHKKNLGIQNSKNDYCLVLHSDICPTKDFYDLSIKNLPKHDEVFCPLIKFGNTTALSWCSGTGFKKPFDEAADKETYISGAAIFGTKEIFKKFPWNEKLRHNMAEDFELSRRMMNNDVKLIPREDLVLLSKRGQ